MKGVRQISWAITAGLLFAGLALQWAGMTDYGWVFFVLFPVAVGFASVVASGTAGRIMVMFAICVVGLGLFLALAIAFGLEGLVCVLMAMPLLFVALFIGAGIALICRNIIWKQRIDRERNLLVVAFPLILLLVADPISRVFETDPATITIASTITLPDDALDVFAALQSMDTLQGDRPWLLRIGLPTPYACELEAEHVGAKRTCIFPNGHITAEVTAYEPGIALRMKVVDYDLTGRHWFHFGDAGYSFERAGTGTKVTRTSAYQSDLRPRWYWEPLEKLGIEQEHEFVLRSLKKNLELAAY